MSIPILLHVTRDLPGRFRRVGLHVVEHQDAVTVWCPGCTERQDYVRVDGGWRGAAFLHDVGCAHFRTTRERLGIYDESHPS
jgi:hypothetical protein